MKITFDLNEKIVKKVQKAYACKTKKQAIEVALQEALRKIKREEFSKKLGALKLGFSLKKLHKIREAD